MYSTISRPALIQQLHQRLTDAVLPGLESHFKMAHPIRKADSTREIPVKREAGVLITLFEKNANDLHVIFIKRSSGALQDKHAGQIAFPGGKFEDGDKDLMYTALREAYEEIDLDLTTIDVLGSLTPLFISVSKFMVYPYVAFTDHQPVLKKQDAEIDQIIILPLAAFRSSEAKQKTKIQVAHKIALNHVPCFNIDSHIIWGATAMIMNELLETIA